MLSVSGALRTAGRIVSGRLMPKGISYPVILGPLQGYQFILGAASGDGAGASVYFNLVEQAQTRAFLECLRPGDVLFDIGANVGYYTLLGAKLVGSGGLVVGVEPAVRNISFLYRHVALNKRTNVIILPAACSDTISLSWFSTGANWACARLVDSRQARLGVAADLMVVPTVTVDEITSCIGLQPNVLKVDVEGAEMLVLRGASETLRRTRPIVFLSTHTMALRASCLNLLQSIDYRVSPLDKADKQNAEFLCRPM